MNTINYCGCVETRQELLQNNFDPDSKVDVVKVPLNAIKADNLRQALLVKGISDWSIVRPLRLIDTAIMSHGIVVTWYV